MTIFKKIKDLWTTFMNNVLHLYTAHQHNSVCEIAKASYEIQIKGLSLANNTQAAAYDELKAKYDKLKKDYDKLNAEVSPAISERDELREKIASYKEAATQNLSYVKDVQKQLSKVLQGSEAFGFPHSTGIPGSTSIHTIDSEQDGNPVVVVRGRTIALDDLTKDINHTPDMRTRLQLIMSYMERYSVFNKIARDLFQYGAVKCTLGYNEKCTNYELYYEIVANQANLDSILVVRNDEE